MIWSMDKHGPHPLPRAVTWLRWLFRGFKEQNGILETREFEEEAYEWIFGSYHKLCGSFCLMLCPPESIRWREGTKNQSVLPDRATHVSASVPSHFTAYIIGPWMQWPSWQVWRLFMFPIAWTLLRTLVLATTPACWPTCPQHRSVLSPQYDTVLWRSQPGT